MTEIPQGEPDDKNPEAWSFRPEIDLYMGYLYSFYSEEEGVNPQKKEMVEEMVFNSYMVGGASALNFVIKFCGLCGNEIGDLRRLFILAGNLVEMSGNAGCDLAFIFEFKNMNLEKLEKAVFAIVHQEYRQIGEGLHDFLYLLNIVDSVGIFNDDLYGVFADLMRDTGLSACQELAKNIKYYDSDDPCPDMARNCALIIASGRFDLAGEYMKVNGLRNASAESKEMVARQAAAHIEMGNFEECKRFLRACRF